MSQFKKKDGKHNRDSHQKTPNIRDEQFSLETFYNAIGDNKHKDNRKEFKDQNIESKEDK